ncbi:MAG: type VII secretion-associated protein [Pseudonocardiaceae bacterium]|nr:type VII secretion-associated protein [Pseudonocardiaceae bacterium]
MRGQEPQAVVIDGAPLMSSAVYAAPDGTLFVGQEAERQAAVDPSRYEPHPKRRIDEGELLLGDTVLRVPDVVRAVLKRAVDEARRVAGDAEVKLLVLTHPADWGAIRGRVLRQAANGLAEDIVLVPEPVAAAVFHAATFTPAQTGDQRTVEVNAQPGETLAVLDLGGGTVDVSVVRRAQGGADPAAARRGGFQVLATRGDPSFGGADIDQALLEHVGGRVSGADGDAWQQLVEGRELPDRRRRRVLRQDVRGAKETLSRHAYTDVPMPPPFADAHVTRADLEELISEPLARAAEMTSSAIADANLRPKQLTAIFLVGGSSRIPMVARLVHGRTGVMPTTLDQPETVVARGALRAVTIDSDRSGGLPGARPHGPPARPAPSVPAGQQGQAGQQGPAPRPGQPGQPPSGPPGQPRPPGQHAPQAAVLAGQRPAGPPGRAGPPPYQQDGPTHRMAGYPARSEPGQRGGKTSSKVPWLIGGAVLLLAAIATTLLVAFSGDEQPRGQNSSNTKNAAPDDNQLAQYQYRFSYPKDWAHAGGDAQKRKVELRPTDALRGLDTVIVQEFPLNYDTSNARGRVVDELRGKVASAGPDYSGFKKNARYVGREFVYYQQRIDGGKVDWYVLFKGPTQVSIGCQYSRGQEPKVRRACDRVASTLAIVN